MTTTQKRVLERRVEIILQRFDSPMGCRQIECELIRDGFDYDTFDVRDCVQDLIDARRATETPGRLIQAAKALGNDES